MKVPWQKYFVLEAWDLVRMFLLSFIIDLSKKLSKERGSILHFKKLITVMCKDIPSLCKSLNYCRHKKETFILQLEANFWPYFQSLTEKLFQKQIGSKIDGCVSHLFIAVTEYLRKATYRKEGLF
jgi:hypothetical protein